MEVDILEELRERAGTTIFGVADAKAYGRKAPEGHRPSDFMSAARSIVIIGGRMLDTPLDGLPSTRAEYTANFHIVNGRLNHAVFELCSMLQESGHAAFPIPYREMPGWNLEKRSNASLWMLGRVATMPRVRDVVNGRLWENLSYRHMAVEAGLGEIGVNNLLITPEHGPRVRFVALLTDAELEPGKPLERGLCTPERCGYACVNACPAGALSRDGGATRKASCMKYYTSLGLPGINGLRCGLCVASCPRFRAR